MISISIFALDQQSGIIKSVEGKVYRVTSDSKDENLNIGDSVYSGDLVNTKNGKVNIMFNDETEIYLSKKTKLSIKKYVIDKSKSKRFAMLKLISGKMKVNVKRKFGNNLFEITSGYIALEIKGTEFYLTNESNKVQLLLTSGIVSVKSVLDKFSNLKLTENKVLTVNGEGIPEVIGMNMALLNKVSADFKAIKKQDTQESNKFKNLNEGEVVSSATKYIVEMRSILSNAYVVLKKVRKEQNIAKLDCVNASVMTIKGHVRRSEDNKSSIDEAIAKSDTNKSKSLLSKIYSSFNEVKQAEVSMRSCDSDVVVLDGNKNVTLDIEEVIVQKDYLEKKDDPMNVSFKDNSDNSKVELMPVLASPYF
jgi:hypothetical protein